MKNVYFNFAYDPNHIGSARGAAWVTYSSLYDPTNLLVLSHDCGSPLELEAVLKRMHSDLDNIQRRANRRFASAGRQE
jgi:hypothetical protein